MNNPSSEGVSTNGTSDETQSLIGHEPGDINSAGSSLISPVMSKEIARQIEAATDPLTN